MLRVFAATGNQDCSSLRWPFEALHRLGLGPACAPCDAVWCEQPVCSHALLFLCRDACVLHLRSPPYTFRFCKHIV